MRRVSVEAGVTDLWWKYLGCQGEAVGINRFGFSAPGTQVLEELGMNVDNVVAAIHTVSCQIKGGIFPFISFQGLFPHPRGQPFFMPPGCQERQGRFHETPVSVTQELYPSCEEFRSFASDFSKYKTSAHQLHCPEPDPDGLRAAKARLQAARFISAAGTDNFRFPS